MTFPANTQVPVVAFLVYKSGTKWGEKKAIFLFEDAFSDGL